MRELPGDDIPHQAARSHRSATINVVEEDVVELGPPPRWPGRPSGRGTRFRILVVAAVLAMAATSVLLARDSTSHDRAAEVTHRSATPNPPSYDLQWAGSTCTASGPAGDLVVGVLAQNEGAGPVRVRSVAPAGFGIQPLGDHDSSGCSAFARATVSQIDSGQRFWILGTVSACPTTEQKISVAFDSSDGAGALSELVEFPC